MTERGRSGSGLAGAPLLSVEGLEARHGLLPAVRGVSLALAEGEKLALVGANGAGKTTLLRTLAGAHPAAAGTVRFDGADVTALPAHRRVALGIALVPEGRRLFPEMTVVENLQVATRHKRPGPWNVDAVLDAFPLLRPLRHRRAANLSGGEQQATAIGRALMTNPRLLLLDEVSLGLAPVAVDTVYASLNRLLATGTTVVLVEQDLGRAMRIADRVVCLLEGRIVLEGAASALTREQVTAAYFGLGSAVGTARHDSLGGSARHGSRAGELGGQSGDAPAAPPSDEEHPSR
ncbi:MAG TPA: ABC transporter ATP-binding protein [Kofleriaceae bacterium]|nr:ABC transporter ATP-binding protein [Kofleriaceae bacterium]